MLRSAAVGLDIECLLIHISDPYDSCIIHTGAWLEVSNEELGLFGSKIRAVQVRRLHPEVALVMSGRVE